MLNALQLKDVLVGNVARAWRGSGSGTHRDLHAGAIVAEAAHSVLLIRTPSPRLQYYSYCAVRLRLRMQPLRLRLLLLPLLLRRGGEGRKEAEEEEGGQEGGERTEQGGGRREEAEGGRGDWGREEKKYFSSK